MEIINTVLVIALWCGNPSGYRLSSNQVNICRQKMLECIRKEDTTHPHRFYGFSVKYCAENIKLEN